jgi:hypothetical protein
MQVRAVFISALSVFTWSAVGLPGPAQDLSASGSPTLRVAASADSTSSSIPESVQSPVLGFITSAPSSLRRGHFLSGRTDLWSGLQVRAILGVPGAATLSSPVALPSGVVQAHFAPGETYALVERSRSTMAVLPFSGGQAGSLAPLPGSISTPDIVTFSPNASAAAVFSAGQGHLLVITGLPGSPQLSRDIGAADLPANVQMLALADDGATLLAGTSDGRVLCLRTSGAPEVVYSTSNLGGVAFMPASTDALVFDGDGNKAVLIQNVAIAPATRLLTQGLTGLSGAAILQVDSGVAIVGAINARELSRIDLQTLQVDQVALPAGLTMLQLQPLRTTHRFLLSAETGQPAWILDTSGAVAAVYFIPQPALAMVPR